MYTKVLFAIADHKTLYIRVSFIYVHLIESIEYVIQIPFSQWTLPFVYLLLYDLYILCCKSKNTNNVCVYNED